MKPRHLLLAPAIGLVAGDKAGYFDKTGVFDRIRTETLCRTPYDTINVTSVPTTHNTVREIYTVNSTSHVMPVVTITPPHITRTTYAINIATVESTIHRKPDQTETTIVATEYKWILVTNTMTTVTERTTETTQTTFVLPTTVPAPKLFVPIRDTVDGITRGRDDGLPNNQSVGIHEPADAEGEGPKKDGKSWQSYVIAAFGGTPYGWKKRSLKNKKRSGVYNNRGGKEWYPKRVICDTTIIIPKTVTYTEIHDVRTITVDPPVFYQTENNVMEITTTVFLPALEVKTVYTTTVDIESSMIATTTYTSTETKTNTVNVAWPTINAMCDEGNYGGSISNRGGFSNGYPSFHYDTAQVDGTHSPFECCEACVKDPQCAGSGWVNGVCTLITVPDGSPCLNKPCSGAMAYSPFTGRAWVFSNGRAMKWDKSNEV